MQNTTAAEKIYNMLHRSKHTRNVFVLNTATGHVTHYPGKKYWEIAPGKIPAELEAAHDWSTSIIVRYSKRDRHTRDSVASVLDFAIDHYTTGRRLLEGLIKSIEEAQQC